VVHESLWAKPMLMITIAINKTKITEATLNERFIEHSFPSRDGALR
jgi:hypothetical protein